MDNKQAYLNSIDTLIANFDEPIKLSYYEPMDEYRIINNLGVVLKKGDLQDINNWLVSTLASKELIS